MTLANGIQIASTALAAIAAGAACVAARATRDTARQTRKTTIRSHNEENNDKKKLANPEGCAKSATGHGQIFSHVTRRQTVAYRPGTLSEALTDHYHRAHPEALGLPAQ